MTITVRTIREDEVEAFGRQLSLGFGHDYRPEAMATRRHFLEVDRSIAAFDGQELAGTASAFTYRMSTPGGEVPCAGVTMVTVKPTHRRQGVLTRMMAHQLADVRARGEPAAALWASEAPIYGRFGYGMAAAVESFRIERDRTAFDRSPAAGGSVRLIDAAEAAAALPKLWEQERQRRPGMMTRSAAWWEHRIFADPEGWRRGHSAQLVALYRDANGAPAGYARYRVKPDHDDQNCPAGHLRVEELIAPTRGAQAALWRYLFGVDLIKTIDAELRPAGDPLPWMLADTRRLRRLTDDGLWLRNVDVRAMLEARRYAAEGRLVLEVVDPFLGGGGRYALEGGPSGATVKPTQEGPALTLRIDDLGALYPGGVHPRVLHDAGRIEGDSRVLDRAGAMFAWPVAPWCPEVF